jgi:hypothetical protein
MRRKDGWAAGALAQASIDTATHDLAVRLARRCVAIIEPMLRQEEIGEALVEYYAVIREELAAGQAGARKP